MKNTFIILLGIITFLSIPLRAQNGLRSLSNLSWLSGYWAGEAFGGSVEEIWSVPSDNTLMGMFRLQYDNEDKLFEFLLIERTDTGINMLFKHIKPGYKEIELEPIVLKLVDLSDNKAEFIAEDKSVKIEYSLIQRDQLEIILTTIENSKTVVTPIKMIRKNI